MKIRRFEKKDLEAAATVHKAAFERQQMSYEWIECNSKAYPRFQIFVAETRENKIVGFIHWSQKSGFRPDVVLELEQLAVLPVFQNKGIGTRLILESLPHVQAQLKTRGAEIKHIMVTTRSDNFAQRLYRKTLNARVESTLRSLYSADEVIMVARHVKI